MGLEMNFLSQISFFASQWNFFVPKVSLLDQPIAFYSPKTRKFSNFSKSFASFDAWKALEGSGNYFFEKTNFNSSRWSFFVTKIFLSDQPVTSWRSKTRKFINFRTFFEKFWPLKCLGGVRKIIFCLELVSSHPGEAFLWQKFSCQTNQ